jgi:serine/threonine protein kinase
MLFPSSCGVFSVIGQTLSHYRVLEQIGSGGMGVVYRAHDEQLDRDVAIKILPAGTLSDEAARKRFRREALALAKLDHPNVATVFEFGSQSGIDFLVIAYIPGITLDAKLASGALPHLEVISIGIQLAAGLTAAHDHDVIHRDLKPGNLRLTPDGLLKILDFGLAQPAPMASELGVTSTLTKSQEITGTLPYMAPEQLRGEPADARSDIWAVGVVLYELSTGKRPFLENNVPLLIDAILNKEPLAPSEVNRQVPEGLQQIILKALTKERANRYQTTRDLRADLERIRMGKPSISFADGRNRLSRSDRQADTQTDSRYRIIASLFAIAFGTFLVEQMTFVLGWMLSNGPRRALAYALAAMFALVATLVIVKLEKKRSMIARAQKKIEAWAQSSSLAAFRSLDPFTEGESLPGTARKRQARQLVTSIKDPTFRFGVVSGDVGCGKTSLLQSEVQRLLKSDNFSVIFLSRTDFAEVKDVSGLRQVITAAATPNRQSKACVLIVDQIEEILLRFSGRASREQIGSLFEELMRNKPPCKIVCAIRKDYFLDLYDLGPTMGVDIRPTLMLRNFTSAEAEDVIQECAIQEGLSLTDDLVKTIVADLTHGAEIRPPELQIVCTALTTNFTMKHYKELGSAKGVLESYLSLAIETCINPGLARLVLRHMCDFERQAKADPKGMDELASAIGPQQDDLGVTERMVHQILDHLVRSRLAITVGGKYSLIHDYWVAVIHDATVHDRSEQERADELLRRYLRERESGFSATLSSKQLRLVRLFADRDLVNTQESKKLIRQSTFRVWISRGIAAGAATAIIGGGLVSSTLTWQMEPLADIGSGQNSWSMHLLKDKQRLLLIPMDFGQQQKGSKLVVWNIDNGKRVSEYAADAWSISPDYNLLLYVDKGQAYSVDLDRNARSMFPQVFEDGNQVQLPHSGHCALFTQSPNTDIAGSEGATPLSYEAKLWSVPDGKLLGSTSLVALRLFSGFVSEKCDQAVLISNEGTSVRVLAAMSDFQENHRPWLWDVRQTKPTKIVSAPTITSAEMAVNEEGQSIVTLEKDRQGHNAIASWDLQSGLKRLVRGVELPSYSYAYLRFGLNGQQIAIFSNKASDMLTGGSESIKIVRASDLQESPIISGQRLSRCTTTNDTNISDDVLWSTANKTSYIWDLSSSDPVRLNGMESTEGIQCTVSPDHSRFALVRKTGSAELWSLKGSKIADLRAGGTVKAVGWTLQGTSVVLERDTGETVLFDADSGAPIAVLPALGSRLQYTSGTDRISFEPSCGHILLWSSDGRVVNYRRKLKMFGLLLPMYSRKSPGCDN